MYHKDFPFGRGVWVHHLNQCLAGNIDLIIDKCKTYRITYLIIKSGDGADMWQQLNRDVVKRFQDAGIKVLSWSYCYGIYPQPEAEVAIKSLDMGVDGHVFDAESEYQNLDNNVQAAETMMQMVRAKYPDKFLAYSPFALIDYHTRFPYVIFGKYCDAVMPQVYYGEWTRPEITQDPIKGVAAMIDNFNRWQQNWIDNGHADSVKPIIPIAQGYDAYNVSPPYILKPADILNFVAAVKSDKSVSFWVFHRILRDDCWEAIRASDLDGPTDEDRGIVRANETVVQPSQVITEAPQEAQMRVDAVQEAPQPTDEQQAVEGGLSGVTVITPASTEETPAEIPGVTVVDQPDETSAEEEQPYRLDLLDPAEIRPDLTDETSDTTPDTTTVTPEPKAQTVELSPDMSAAAVKVGQKTTIVIDPDAAHPEGVKVTVRTQKTHRDMFLEFVRYLLSLFTFKH